MQVGYSVGDITPSPGLTLSGFAARCNRPSTGVDDPIQVHALAIKGDETPTLLLVFDLLALGRELTFRLHKALKHALTVYPNGRPEIILCCTHTHSAPATIKLLGCGIPDLQFWNSLEQAAAQAALEAFQSLRPAVISYSTPVVPGVSHNRRIALPGNRVVMSVPSGQTDARRGRVWDRALLVRFDTPGGDPIAGIVSWAAHPCVVCSSSISADYPGELRRSLSTAFGLPFLFLQGPCGNINLPFRKMNRPELIENVRKITPRLLNTTWSSPATAWPVKHAADEVLVEYSPIPEREELEEIRDGMTILSATGKGPASTMLLLANILNAEPGSETDSPPVRHTAAAIAQWSSEILANAAGDWQPPAVSLNVLRLGPLWFLFVAAELFAETGLALQDRFPGAVVTPIGYASPLVGYLPTDDALLEGGYEVDFAYRFYGHPAPFAPGSEARVRARIETMISSMEEGSHDQDWVGRLRL